jgi:hypothetical protein
MKDRIKSMMSHGVTGLERVKILSCLLEIITDMNASRKFEHINVLGQGPGSLVSIATGCGLDRLGIESWWGRDFSHMSRLALGPTQPPVQWVPSLSQG